ALLVATHRSADAARLAERVQLVDEHDARRIRLRLLEQVAHARRTNAHEHLDELGAADREERDTRFSRDGPREERLARARGADEEYTLRDAGTDTRKFVRCAQEVDDFDEFGLRFVRTRNILERNPRALLAHDASAVAA